MNNHFMFQIVFSVVIIHELVAACIWPSTFANTTWLDNTHGTLSFTNSTMSGLTMTLTGVTHNTWDCVDNSSSSRLIMKSQSMISFTGFAFQLSVYLCLDLVPITSVSYYYYQRHEVHEAFGYERVYVSSTNNVKNSSEICNFKISIATAEFHVMVKSGNVSDAKVTCPSGILGKYDYVYYAKDNSSALCNSSKDLWDGCTDKTMVTFNYTTCTQKIAYSGGGVVWCVANIGDTYGVVYNNDSSFVSSNDDRLATYRFSCIVGNHASASIAPGNCTSQQTAASYPVKWNSINRVNDNAGVYLTLSPYATVTPVDVGPNAGVIVGSVLAAVGVSIFAMVIIVVIVRNRKKDNNKTSTENVTCVTHYANMEVGKPDATGNMTDRSREEKETAFAAIEVAGLQRGMPIAVTNVPVYNEYEKLRDVTESTESAYSTVDRNFITTPR